MRVSGERVSLPADLAASYALILHELATNAAKHGALSRPTGTVAVTWQVVPRDTARVLSLTWRETGAPPVKAPLVAGFGTELIEHGIPTAIVRRDFAPDGLVCTIELTLPDKAEAADG